MFTEFNAHAGGHFSEDTYEREILADVLAWRLRKGHGKFSITGDGYIWVFLFHL